jgi:hypothetical protein
MATGADLVSLATWESSVTPLASHIVFLLTRVRPVFAFFDPNLLPDFKRLFEIYHFYVEGKANTEKTFRRLRRRAKGRAKQAPERGERPGLGRWEEA